MSPHWSSWEGIATPSFCLLEYPSVLFGGYSCPQGVPTVLFWVPLSCLGGGGVPPEGTGQDQGFPPGQTNKPILLPSRRSAHAGGNNVCRNFPQASSKRFIKLKLNFKYAHMKLFVRICTIQLIPGKPKS